MNVVIRVLGQVSRTRAIKIWLWDFASLKFVWRAEKTLVASKGGSETESETCLYNSLGQFVLVLKVVPSFIEGGWLIFLISVGHVSPILSPAHNFRCLLLL